MEPVDWNLSWLQAGAYHDQLAVLELAFRNGAVYRYFGVPGQPTTTCCDLIPRASSSIPTSAFVSRAPKSRPRAVVARIHDAVVTRMIVHAQGRAVTTQESLWRWTEGLRRAERSAPLHRDE